MPALPELIRDPIFQLNVLLWLAQPLPSGDAITPLLHSRGFDVYALALRLSLPPDLLLVMRNGGFEVQVGVRPDIILAKESSGKFAITECKGSSFGNRSSTAHQARTLLALAGPRCHEVLGLQPQAVRESTLTYLLPSISCRLLNDPRCVPLSLSYSQHSVCMVLLLERHFFWGWQ